MLLTPKKGETIMPLTLPTLPYALTALEPHIDAKTMEIHNQKHHKAYVDNCNKATDGTPFAAWSGEELITKLAELPEDKRGPVRNNAGGHVNHSMFWTIMAPAGQGGGGEPAGELGDLIKSAFGGLAEFKTAFAAAGVGRFGSGWAWLCWDKEGKKLAICTTANQDNPMMGKAIAGCGGVAILACDVW